MRPLTHRLQSPARWPPGSTSVRQTFSTQRPAFESHGSPTSFITEQHIHSTMIGAVSWYLAPEPQNDDTSGSGSSAHLAQRRHGIDGRNSLCKERISSKLGKLRRPADIKARWTSESVRSQIKRFGRKAHTSEEIRKGKEKCS